MPKTYSRLRGLLFSLMVLAGLPQAVLAYNVPGSAQAHVPEITEIATGIIVRSMKDTVRPMREGTGSVQVSTSGTMSAVSATGGGRTPLSFSVTHRQLDTARLDGTLDVATLFFGARADNGITYFGGLIGETGNIRTPMDNGRVKHSGVGLALGVDYAVSERFYLTALVGGLALDYDVARGGGAVTGSFGATRRFADLSADYVTRAAGGDLTLGFGLLYVQQKHDGYTESGGAAVAPFRFDQLSLSLDARNTWGHDGAFRPYVDMSAQLKLAGDSSGAGAATPVHADRQARLGFGVERSSGLSFFDVGLGANFDDDAFSGIDARLNYTLRF